MNISLSRNITANYVSQAYVTVLGIAMLPLYMNYMGVEAYGLVGFFTMTFLWFQMLDMGLGPTMSRETARFRGGATDGLTLRRLLRTLEVVFVAVAVLGGGVMMALSDAITLHWLNVQHLPMEEVQNAVMLMASIIPLRLISGLYRSAVLGFEDQVWLSSANAAVATARYVLVVPFFILVGTSPTEFFSFQLLVAIVELLALVWRTYWLMLRAGAGLGARVSWQWQPLKRVLKFSLVLAFTSSVWVLITQTDKLILSTMLPLSEYAYFMLAVTLASGVIMIGWPISVALLPRLTSLTAQGNEVEMIRLYRNATQMVGIIAIPAALVLACFSKQVLWAWTGDAQIAREAAPVLTLYALGNGILAFGAFPYYLQYAKGDLRLHLFANMLFLLILVPALVWGTWKFGAIGAGYAWLGTNIFYILFYVPKVHRRFSKELHASWILHDISAIVAVSLAVIGILYLLLDWPQQRITMAAAIASISTFLVVISAAGSSWARNTIRQRWTARILIQG